MLPFYWDQGQESKGADLGAFAGVPSKLQPDHITSQVTVFEVHWQVSKKSSA